VNLICPKCLNEETVRLNLDDGDTLTCTGCDEEYTVGDVAALVASWAPLLKWLQSHPARQSAAAATVS
jgi:hypothetical protein